MYGLLKYHLLTSLYCNNNKSDEKVQIPSIGKHRYQPAYPAWKRPAASLPLTPSTPQPFPSNRTHMPPSVPLPRHKTLPTPILPFSSNLSNTAILIPNYFPPSLTMYALIGKHLLNVISKLRLICLLNGWRYQTNFSVIFVGNIIHSHQQLSDYSYDAINLSLLLSLKKKKIRFTKWGKYGCR